jgi:hypothetical protein
MRNPIWGLPVAAAILASCGASRAADPEARGVNE